LPAEPNAEVAILFTSAFARLQGKYGLFGYKLSQLDTGVAVSQLQLAARAMNLWSSVQPFWADDVIESFCNLIPGEEHSAAVLALSRPKETLRREAGVYLANSDGLAIPRSSVLGASGRFADERRVPKYSEMSLGQLYEYVYQESRMSHSEALDKLSLLVTSRRSMIHVEMRVPFQATSNSLIRSLMKRRSVRHFSHESLTMEDVSCILYSASSSDLFEERDPRSSGLNFYVAAKRVQGLTPAVYRYDVVAHSMYYVGALPTVDEEQHIFFGEDYSTSAAFVWIGGDIQAMCDSEGAFGHRKLLLRAGAMANRLLLCSVGLGIDGVILAGLRTDSTRWAFAFDGAQNLSLVAVVVGKSTGSAMLDAHVFQAS